MSTDLPQVSLEKIADFHAQLLRLHAAGIVFELAEPPGNHREFKERLDGILAYLATQRATGQSLDKVMLSSDQVPATYRTALATWMRDGGSVDALSTLHRPALERIEAGSDYRLAFLQPQIIAVLVYLGTIFLLLGTATHLEGIYNQVRLPFSWPLRCVLVVRDSLPIWGPLLPIVYLAFLWWLMRGSITQVRWMPGRRSTLKTLSAGEYATNLSNLIQVGTPADEALTIVGPWTASGSSRDIASGATPPPVLQWALSKMGPSSLPSDAPAVERDGTSSRAAGRLQFAAGLYDAMRRFQVDQRRAWLPLILGTTLGGGMVLLYGLALFAPMAELLKDLVRS